MINQGAFAAALLDPDRPPPDGLRVRPGDDLARCFAVYRNNVAISLIDCLAERFSVTQRLVGEDFFRAMARVYSMASPPTSPLMATYGDGFPDFIADFPHTVGLPYLADVARLEAARTRAYHAADAPSLDPEAFQALPPERLGDCRLTFHPSMECLPSPWAIATIWSENSEDDAPPQIDPAVPEDVIVVRPALDVLVHKLHAGSAAFIAALAQGETLAGAVGAAADIPGFDPIESLAQAIAMRITIAIDPNELMKEVQ